jgi:hypothetical protein
MILTHFCWSLAWVFFKSRSSMMTDCFCGSTILPFIWNPFIKLPDLKRKNIFNNTHILFHVNSIFLVFKVIIQARKIVLLGEDAAVSPEELLGGLALPVGHGGLADELLAADAHTHRAIVKVINQLGRGRVELEGLDVLKLRVGLVVELLRQGVVLVHVDLVLAAHVRVLVGQASTVVDLEVEVDALADEVFGNVDEHVILLGVVLALVVAGTNFDLHRGRSTYLTRVASHVAD